MTTEKLPKVPFRLEGSDGNAMMLIGGFRLAAKRIGWPAEEIERVSSECMSGDYDHLLQTLLAVCE